MPLHWQPVGPLPAATYWKRRAGVLAAALLVLLLLVWAWPGGGDDTLEQSASPSPSASPSAMADPTADPSADPTADPSASPTAASDVCGDDVLEVTAAPDASSYAAGSAARLTLTVKNTGTVPCRRALGQGAVELVVTSGDDRIWSSDDCAPGGEQGEELLEPGGERTARATWSGTRSAPGCPEGQPAAQPGTYRVSGRVGELRVPGGSFEIT